ncbi:mucin-5AC-like [Betta splendens]|uniref:Mucin-5AC-like n=1 Tax=Betta splendens TaxID=158456 RepID=A0A9W2XA90_BETSP|nr:mucin-5AC-like [Betta splendens]
MEQLHTSLMTVNMMSLKCSAVFCRQYVTTTTTTTKTLTEVEVVVEFNDHAAPGETPQASDVAKTLGNAVSNPNNTFNLTVDSTTIQAVVLNETNPTAVVPNLTTTEATQQTPISATPAPTTETTAATSTASGTTTFVLVSAVLNTPYEPQLNDSSSVEFKTLETEVVQIVSTMSKWLRGFINAQVDEFNVTFLTIVFR